MLVALTHFWWKGRLVCGLPLESSSLYNKAERVLAALAKIPGQTEQLYSVKQRNTLVSLKYRSGACDFGARLCVSTCFGTASAV